MVTPKIMITSVIADSICSSCSKESTEICHHGLVFCSGQVKFFGPAGRCISYRHSVIWILLSASVLVSASYTMARQDETEELEQNIFFKCKVYLAFRVCCCLFDTVFSVCVQIALKLRCPDLYKLAAEQQQVICVPCQLSTQGLPLNRTNFEQHIIQPSPFFAGVYETVNGKTLDFEVSCSLCTWVVFRINEPDAVLKGAIY